MASCVRAGQSPPRRRQLRKPRSDRGCRPRPHKHDAIDRVPGLDIAAAHVKQGFREALIEHSRYVREHGEDMPQIRDWVWPNIAAATRREAGD